MLRFCLFGAGRIGTLHAGNIAAHPGARLASVVDVVPAAFSLEPGAEPLAFLDSAVTSQKPRQVLDAIRDFYATSYSNVHRGVYTLSERATEGYEGAREKVRAFINAPSTRELIFVRQATEGLNLVAYAWGLDNLGPGDVAIVTELEHHSNFVPWQQIAKRTGADFRMIPIDDRGELRMDLLDEVAGDGNVKVVAANLVSNSLGTVNPIEKLAAWAHERGSIMVVDAAQAAPHKRIDVQTLGADFVAFSSHKMCGPTGVGVLWGRRELFESMSPFNYGGSMIRSSSPGRNWVSISCWSVRGGSQKAKRRPFISVRVRSGYCLPRRDRPIFHY